MLSELGHIPRAGERVEFEGRRFTVTAMERNRIAKVGVEKISAVAEPKGESQLAGN
jgi:CBS domain containing-hemolysin-like protein